MTSPKQIQANQRNAQKSSGPKTQEGKNAVRYNAMKHGLLAQVVLLPNEDEDALRELDERLRSELEPVGALENLLVEQIVAARWRLARLGRVEAGIFTWELYAELAQRAHNEARSYEKQETYDRNFLKPLTLSWTTDEKKYQEALSKAQEMEALRDAETATLGKAFMRDAEKANAFSKLSRYETAIERSLYKALHELQRLQAARLAKGNVSPPVAVDVDISGVSKDAL